ncbi:saccharopine dehydrogenase [Colletotrichum tofieldiae]|nr:saccharopine dehydrogenase [Colletotrichum tofieldiae]
MADKKILVLGSGLVAKPCVDYLLRNERNKLTIACRTRATAETLASNYPRATAIALDVASPELNAHVAAHDLVISLVPFVHHPTVIKAGIKGNTHVVTTSYVSPAIRELGDEAQAAGITVLNEVGVDPGETRPPCLSLVGESGSQILFRRGSLQGWKSKDSFPPGYTHNEIKEFHSYCGGLPAPECADNPLRFKFSWSPRGALLSQFNSASYLQGGKVVEISNQDLMAQAQPYHVADGYSFVAYPNRNSVPFREFYNIPEAETVVRGSLRYEGNPSFVAALIKLGWLDTQPRAWLEKESGGLTLREVLGRIISAHGDDEESLIARIDELCSFSDNVERERIISGLRWIGLFSEKPATLRGNPLDTLCAELERLLSFQPGERDLVMLQHKFVIQWEDGRKVKYTTSQRFYSSALHN